MTTYELKGLAEQPYLKALPELEHLLTRLANEPQSSSDRRYIIDVMCIVFGVDGCGWLSQCADDMARSQTSESKVRFDRLMSLMEFGGPFWRILENFKNNRCILKLDQLPVYMQKEIKEMQQNINSGRASQSAMLTVTQQYSSVFQAGQVFFESDRCNPTIVEWFFFQLVSNLKRFVWERRNPKPQETYFTDEFFHGLNCNPYLSLLHRYLQRFAMMKDQELKIKVCFLIREYFVRDVIRQGPTITQYSANYGASDVQRGKRSHHLQAVHLLIYYSLAHNIIQPKEMEQFFSIVFRSNNTTLLVDAVRVWLYYIRPSDRIESQIIGLVAKNHKAAQKDRIEMIKPYDSNWLLERNEDPATEQMINLVPSLYCELFHQVVQSFSDGQGYPSRQLSYPDIYTLDCMVTYFLKSEIINKQIIKTLTSEKRTRSFKQSAEILIRMVQGYAIEFEKHPDPRLSQGSLNAVLENIRTYRTSIKEGLSKIYNISVMDRVDSSYTLPQAQSNRYSKVNVPFTRRSIELNGSPWVMPIASYEFAPAFYFWMCVAKVIDWICIRGLTTVPLTNLRWLASYKSTAIFMAIVVILLLLFVDWRGGQNNY